MSEENGLRDDAFTQTLNQRFETVLDNYIAWLSKKPRETWPSDKIIGEQAFSRMQDHVRLTCRSAGRGEIRDRMPNEIPYNLVVKLLRFLHRFVIINFMGDDRNGDQSPLAVYIESGENAGIYGFVPRTPLLIFGYKIQ